MTNTDIAALVERLRAASPKPDDQMAWVGRSLLREAADALEALQTQVTEIRKVYYEAEAKWRTRTEQAEAALKANLERL